MMNLLFFYRSEIGLLSLFEHYGSCKVGENLKSPEFPIWLVCSESHFTVLFSDKMGVQKTSLADRNPVNLYYYDGLAGHWTEPVVFTIDCTRGYVGPREGDPDLEPPLELCLKTKWVGASIDWNGAEKIL